MNFRKFTAGRKAIWAVAIFLTVALLAPVSSHAQAQKAIEVKAVDGAAFEASAGAGPRAAEGLTENIAVMALGVAAIGTAYAAAPQLMIIGVGMGVNAGAGAIAYTKTKEALESKK